MLTGKDIRQEGDGNGDARNVMHVAGLAAGMPTLALEAGKGAAADLSLCRAGVALVLGHEFPVWLDWRGGKGLAARAAIHGFNASAAIAAAAFLVLSFIEGNTLGGVACIVAVLGTTGVKHILDLPYERALRARTHP